MSKMHDIVAKRIAKKFDVFYNAGRGPDIMKYPMVIEVVLSKDVEKGMNNLTDFEGPSYLAGVTSKAIEKARKVAKGTCIGVMDQNGKILKRSTR